MKKLIFSIAALAAIVVMGSCSQDSDLTNKTASSKTTDSVTVSLNLNSGIEVSESQSPISRAASTRADATSPANFAATVPTKYTAYFVAAVKTDEFAKGALVRIVDVNTGSNTISVPAIPCNIYITNYTPETALSVNATTDAEASVKALEDDLPMSSTTLYLFGKTGGVDFSKATSASVTLTNHYAAVCVQNNTNANSVNYISGVAFNGTGSITYLANTAYVLDTNTPWYYLYIKATDTSNTALANTSATSNSTITLNSSAFPKDLQNSTWPLDKDITAANIYQYTVSPTNGGQGATLTVNVNAFTGSLQGGDLNVY
jgi:hypothetical protein